MSDAEGDKGRQRVRVAEAAGFCFGVQRALEMAFDKAESVTRKPVYALGPLIHNRQVVGRLEEMGVRVVDSVQEAEGGVLLIRAHGVPRSVLREAEERGIQVADTTCPFVKRVHERAQDLGEQGYDIVIVGEREHPEVVGILGWVDGEAHVVEKPADVDRLPALGRVGVVAQTTQTTENLAGCVRELLSRCRELRIYNTLCDATMQRQRAAAELARQVGTMIVVGGHHSGNTRRLADICRATGTPTHHIETAEDIDPRWLEDLAPEESVGLTAGASTPDWAMNEIIEALSSILGHDTGPRQGA